MPHPPLPARPAPSIPATRLRLLHPALVLAALLSVSTLPSRAADPTPASLPEAPSATLAADLANAPALAATAFSSSAPAVQTPPTAPASPLTSRERDRACQAGQLHGKPCRASWAPILWEAFESTALQNAGNLALDDETRHDVSTLPYWSTYVTCVKRFRYNQWRDDDDFMVDYVGHGMQGGIVGASFLQHDPMGRGMVYTNNGVYWRSRLKGMAWIAVYEVQWKIGPAGEASIGSSGLNSYYTPRVHGRTTNETGFQDFVDTPLVGFGWNVGEDAIDRFLMPRIWRHTHNKLALSALFVLTPCKAAANVLRFKPLYYRDFDLPPVTR